MVQYQTTVDLAFAVLADPTRRAVLERLGDGNATMSEFTEPCRMSLTGMKNHRQCPADAHSRSLPPGPSASRRSSQRTKGAR